MPLRLPHDAPVAGARLNPVFEIEGTKHVMVTQFAGAIPVRTRTGGRIAGDRHDQIVGASDVLITDY